MNRANDWLRQAERDYEEAKYSHTGGFHEWVCFLSQQSAEKAVKAISEFEKLSLWGHSVSNMLKRLSTILNVPPEIIENAKILDRYYIPTRYPNGFESGAPMDYYTEKDAIEALEYGKTIIEFAKQHLQK